MALHAHDQLQAASQCYARANRLDPKRFDALYYWGHALAATGDYPAAVERLRQAVALRQESTPAQMKLAEVLYAAGDVAASAGVARQILQREPENATAHYTLGRAMDGPPAIEEFRQALRIFPRYGAAQFALATAYRQSGQPELAQETLRTYERDKLLVPPLPDPEIAAMKSLEVSPTGLMRRARVEEAGGRLDDAVALHLRAIAMEPDLADAWVNLIGLYARLERDEDAAHAYQRAVSLAPQRAEVYYNYAVFCLMRQRLGDAKVALQRTIDLDPRHPDALHNLGQLLEGEGRWSEAAALYKRAVAAKAAFPLAHFHLGRIYANQKKYAAAIGEFEQSLEPPGDSTPTCLYALAATHARAGNRSKARELMREARRQAVALGQTDLLAGIDRDLAALDVDR